ncbi:MAG TPA: hypothetical protein VFE45_00840 [Coriobacteriia bacterium]|nr:hypothetical protein [Coriobacteriia bacterium]
MTRDPNASLSLARFFAPAPPLYRPVDVTGWTPEDVDDLMYEDAWAEAAYADDLAHWQAHRLAVFFGQSRDWRPSSVETASRALSRQGQDVAATLTDDPLRGDVLSPAVVSIVELIRPASVDRPEPVDRGPWGGA